MKTKSASNWSAAQSEEHYGFKRWGANHFSVDSEGFVQVQPLSDGRTIRLNLPPLTEERRKEIVKDLKKKAEDDKVALRNIRRDAIDRLKKLEKDKAITEDELKKYEKDVQDVTKSFETRIDEAVAHKEKEVMEV